MKTCNVSKCIRAPAFNTYFVWLCCFLFLYRKTGLDYIGPSDIKLCDFYRPTHVFGGKITQPTDHFLAEFCYHLNSPILYQCSCSVSVSFVDFYFSPFSFSTLLPLPHGDLSHDASRHQQPMARGHQDPSSRGGSSSFNSSDSSKRCSISMFACPFQAALPNVHSEPQHDR